MPPVLRRPNGPRRGVTLVEMLVSVALLVLMMTIIVQVFAAATGAVSTAKTFADLDTSLRQLDGTIRQDLKNITATLTPPLNPSDNKGYFEYGENSFADLQGEDIDDYLRFTVLAPEGKFFTGRVYLNPPAYVSVSNMSNAQIAQLEASQPITVTSQAAEIIYFLRNGNLYRRVLLVAPDKQTSIIQSGPPLVAAGNFALISSAFHYNGTSQWMSWQGVNDLSARPVANASSLTAQITLNTLGDLTNRENRYAYSRFDNDWETNPSPAGTVPAPDGIPDDENLDAVSNAIRGDGIHDYYPSLYGSAQGGALNGILNASNGFNDRLVWEFSNSAIHHPARTFFNNETMAFPYVFPGAYTKPDVNSDVNGLGWIHSPDPSNNQTTVPLLNALNHNPIDLGDSLPVPLAPGTAPASSYQTWFGFPTWRETLSYFWNDPCFSMTLGTSNLGYHSTTNTFTQPNFLHPYSPGNAQASGLPSFAGGPSGYHFLPPMSNAYQLNPPLFTENALGTQGGDTTLATDPVSNATPGPLWDIAWEDDLIMTGVRSFDVKAYDNSFPGYVDLGWGDDLRLYQPYNAVPATPPFLAPSFHNNVSTTPAPFTWPPINTGYNYDPVAQTYAHEGRMPPRVADLRYDAAYGNSTFVNLNANPPVNFVYNGNVGDDNNVVRLRRVWDTWSTDYAQAPATGYDPTTFAPIGPPFTPPVYPSYPAPYPMPLRGLQIQIRVVDPASQKIKVLTIKQDFSDRQ